MGSCLSSLETYIRDSPFAVSNSVPADRSRLQVCAVAITATDRMQTDTERRIAFALAPRTSTRPVNFAFACVLDCEMFEVEFVFVSLS